MEHPIGTLMQTTLENIKDMVDVNTVIGDPIAASSGVTVIPFSKVSFGFATGGGDYEFRHDPALSHETQPFAGGSGAGVSVQPVGFLVIGPEGVRLLPAQNKTALERAVGCAPQLVEDIKNILANKQENQEQKGLL